MTEEKFNPPIALEDTERKTKDVDYELCFASATLLTQAIREKHFREAFYYAIDCVKFLEIILTRGGNDRT